MRLLLPFDTDDSEFARGFEAGRIWATLQNDPEEPARELIHAGNAEMMIRMAEATGRAFEAEDLGNDWIEISFGVGHEAFAEPEGAE